MKLLFTILACFGIICTASARTHQLQGGVSPNRLYTVKAVESDGGKKITYDLASVRSGAVLHQFESSYQPGADDMLDWAWDHASDAEVCWSPDSRYVAIDEQTHRYGGRVLLYETGTTKRAVDLPEDLLQSRGAERAGGGWDRCRIRIAAGWISPRDLSLVIAGYVEAGKTADGLRTFRFVSMPVTVRVDRGKVRILQIGKPEFE